MVDNFESDIGDAISQDLKKASLQSIPLRSSNGATQTEHRRAIDQLALAVAGILKMEADLRQLTEELVGTYKEEARDNPTPTEGLPMFDRVRADATTLAELAIRVHRRIQFIRETL